jgi:hypothetical protein
LLSVAVMVNAKPSGCLETFLFFFFEFFLPELVRPRCSIDRDAQRRLHVVERRPVCLDNGVEDRCAHAEGLGEALLGLVGEALGLVERLHDRRWRSLLHAALRRRRRRSLHPVGLQRRRRRRGWQVGGGSCRCIRGARFDAPFDSDGRQEIAGAGIDAYADDCRDLLPVFRLAQLDGVEVDAVLRESLKDLRAVHGGAGRAPAVRNTKATEA